MNQDPRFTDDLEACEAEAALYALGTLPAEQARAIELRLRSGCAFCRALVAQYSELSVDLSLAAPAVPPPPGLKEKLLARLAAQEADAANTEHRKVVRGSDGPWMKMPVPGVEIRPLLGEKTFLIRMQPGAVFPKHDHPQAEQCYVISGSITDSDGLTLHAGDFVVMSRGIQHDPIRSDAGCTLFIAYAD